MGMVNIVVDVPNGHLASIYALVMSIITNKYRESIYHIYLSGQNQALSRLDALLSLQTDTVKMTPVTQKQPPLPVEEAVRLQWNMLVMGDLTELTEQNEQDATILQSDPVYNPEEYFDHPFADRWLKYYKMSPMKQIPLRRRSYIETRGEISVSSPELAVPLAISTCDRDIPSAAALLQSIRGNTGADTQLDIRFFYRNLSREHADRLLSYRDDHTSIVLYNVKRCKDANTIKTRILPVLSAFDEYETVIYADSKCICMDDIAALYQNAANPYDVRVAGPLPETDDMPRMILLNTESWIQNNLCSRYYTLSRKYRHFQELVYLAGGKKVGCVPSFAVYSFGDKENPWTNQEEAATRLAWSYLSRSPDFEQLKAEALSYDKQQEVVRMQELLQQLKDLEMENQRLTQQIKFLDADNKTLRTERDRFLYELQETRDSRTYRIARAITFLPRKRRGENSGKAKEHGSE